MSDPRSAMSGDTAAFGLICTSGPGDPSRWKDAADVFAEVERSGCEALWFVDHLFFDRDIPDCLTMAAIAAASTRRCLVGTAVLQLPLRRPAAVAKAISTVQMVADRRFVLGLGAGEHAEEYERCGVDFTDRSAALDRSVDELGRLWRPEEGWFAQRPTPPPVPIWFGGSSAASMRRTVSWGHGWMPMFLSPRRFRERNDELTARLTSAGRDPGEVARATVVFASVTDRRWTDTDAVEWVAGLFPRPGAGLGRHVLTGSVDRVREQLAAFHESGADHVAILPANPDAIAMYAALVLT